MSGKKSKILMPVYNTIEHDGRVQRTAQTLGAEFEVTVLALDSGSRYSNERFFSKAVSVRRFRSIKALGHLYFWLQVWFAAVLSRPHIVHAHDFFMAFPGCIAGMLCGAKFVYDSHELIVPEEGFHQSFHDRVFYLLEKWAIKRADLVIVASEERAKIIRTHYRLVSTPLTIRNISPTPVGVLKSGQIFTKYPQLRRDQSERIRLVYQGDMSLDRGIGKIISALKCLNGGIKLLLVGSGPDVSDLHQMIEECGVAERVINLGKVPRDHLYDILRTCDIGIVTYSLERQNSIYCAPNKIYEYAQAGLPMVANNNPTVKAIFEEYMIGEGTSDIVEGIKTVYSNSHDYRAKIAAFLEANNWDNEAEKLKEAYRILHKKKTQ